MEKRIKKKNLRIRFSKEVKDLLAQKGFDPDLGARPLKRVIQQEIVDLLSLKIVSGEIKEGDGIIIDVKGGEIVIQGPKEILETAKKDKALTS